MKRIVICSLCSDYFTNCSVSEVEITHLFWTLPHQSHMLASAHHSGGCDSFNKTPEHMKSRRMPQRSLRGFFPLRSAWREDGDDGLAEHVQFRVNPRRSPKSVTRWWKTSFPCGVPKRSPGQNVGLFSFQPPVFTDSTGRKSRSADDFLILCWCHPEALSLGLGTSSSPPVPLWTV